MNSVDDIFTAKQGPQAADKAFDKEAWAADKKKECEAAFALIDETSLRLINDENMLQAYLDVQSRFDRYSVGNALLLAAQMPEATRLADFDTWKKSDVKISKGSHGITLIEPGEEYIREDGSTGVVWNTKKVFDISQTDAKREEAPKVSLDERLLLRALINNAPCELAISPMVSERMTAIYNPAKHEIQIRKGQDGISLFRSLSYELALAHMDHGDFSRADGAFTASCVSYILCRRNGIPVDGVSLERKPKNSEHMDTKEVRRELEKIRDVFWKMHSNMRQFLDAQNRREKKHDDTAR